MPTDNDPTPPPEPSGGAPPKAPPAPPPAGPSKDEVQAWVREALADIVAGGGKPPDAPDLSTDKKLEAYVEAKVAEALEVIKKAEAAEGKPSPAGAGPDPTPEPEGEPEPKTTWQQKLQGFVWGSPPQ